MAIVKRSVFGNPVDTEAIINKPESIEFNSERLVRTENGFLINMHETEMVFGLGENVRGINKRGWKYRSFATDEPHHHENTESLYGAHNFFILSSGSINKNPNCSNKPQGKNKLGVFIDCPFEVKFDVGYSKSNEFVITLAKQDFELYQIEGENYDDIIAKFREMIGMSYVPPLWAFGYGQCRWSYMSGDEIRKVADGYEKNDMPIDMIYLDIDYMDSYKDFTINNETFGGFEELVSDMKAKNIHLIPIIDAGVKMEEGYDVYEEGRKNNYFCKDENGEDYVVGVWPGRCCFPDMLNDEARAWFGDKYKVLTDKGIDGFWNDMNEPAIFYGEKRLSAALEKMGDYRGKNLSLEEYFEMRATFNNLSNSDEDYENFYHNYKGQRFKNIDVHNLFGYYMTRGASEAFERINPDKRFLMFSRSSYVGMHRYGGIWQGDNKSWWSHILMNLKMMPSLNMCGFLYTGADTGGFGEDTTEDLLLRWLALSVFFPLLRNHSAMSTRRQEPYEFERKKDFADVISVRYRLLPFIYSEYMKAALFGKCMFRPLAFEYEKDDIACHVEDQMLVGNEIMIAPVYEQNAIGRVVYIPEKMQLIRFKSGDVIKDAVYDKGHHFIKVDLDEVILFIRENKKLPISKGGRCVPEVDFDNIEIISFGDNPEKYEYYMDNGETKEYSEANISMI